tara:strand:- start:352 stop:897 length:546 start_codon:yes stop_codon:yes gene_type:complete
MVATVREAVGVFNDADTMQAAIDELLSAGFDRAELSLLAGEPAVREKLGHMYVRVEEVEDDPKVARTAYVSPESLGDAEGAVIGGLLYVGAVTAAGAVVASGGALAAAITAAAAAGATGGLIGAVLAGFIADHHADYVATQLERGGLLLWVNLRDDEHMERAIDILSRNSAHDVHVHTIPA